MEETAGAVRRGVGAWTAALCLGTAQLLFLVNDFPLTEIAAYGAWLVTDYGFRLAALLVVLAHPALRTAARKALRRPKGLWSWVNGIPLVAVVTVVLLQEVEPLLAPYGLWPTIGGPPLPDAWAPFVFDMTIGLALVAFSEELIGRALPLAVGEALGWPQGRTMVLACVAFGLWHWSGGAATVALAAVCGGLLMALYRRTGSLWPAVAAHYLANLVLFWAPPSA